MDDLAELDEAGKGTLSQDAGGAQSPRKDDDLAEAKDFVDEDLRGNMRSPLQSSVHANRIVAALQEKIDKMQVLTQEQENRIVKLEHQTGISIDDMKKGKDVVKFG